jgi:spermidine synthase
MGPVTQPARAAVPFSIRVALAITGCSAIVSQIVLMREFLIVACGNELSLGILLSLWLVLTAAGSALLGRAFAATSPRRLFSVLLLTEALALFAAIWILRASRFFFNATPGEVLGPAAVLLIALAGLAVFCLVAGALFAVGSRLYASYAEADTGRAGSSMYLLEAIGSTVGGALASILFVHFFGSLQVATFVAAANVLAAIGVGFSTPATRRLLSAITLIAAVAGVSWSPRLERISVSKLWPGFKVLAARTSPYGSLAVIETEANRSIVQNGIVLFTAPDQAFAEEAVHFPLLEHPAPRSVLLIGGGLNGSVAEILKYPTVTSIDYVELDPAVVRLAREYLPATWFAENAPRVHIHEIDGRLYLQSTNRRFDAVILNLPEPQTGQINRFYTEEFFRVVSSHLAPGGIFGFQMRASEEYLSPQMADFLRCLNATLVRVFANTIVIPGEAVHFLASQQSNTLFLDPQLLLNRLRERGVHTQFVSEYYLPFRLAPDRIRDLEEQLRPTAHTRVNRDFAPIAYFFDIELWATQFSSWYRSGFEWAARIPIRVISACLLLLLIFSVTAFATVREAPSRIRIAAAGSVAAMGLTVMATEIILLLGFQAVHGYVFGELAVITAGFMSGMAIGSWRAPGRSRSGEDHSGDLWRLLYTQIAATAIVLLVTPVIAWAGKFSGSEVPSWFVQGTFLLIALISGAIGGYQFPLAMRAYTRDNSVGNYAPGILYGIDLFGASLGALFISIYLLPVFGFVQTAALAALANLAPMVMLGLSLHTVSASPR